MRLKIKEPTRCKKCRRRIKEDEEVCWSHKKEEVQK